MEASIIHLVYKEGFFKKSTNVHKINNWQIHRKGRDISKALLHQKSFFAGKAGHQCPEKWDKKS